MAKNEVRTYYTSDTRGLKRGTQEAEGLLARANAKGKETFKSYYDLKGLAATFGVGLGVGTIGAFFGSTTQAASSLNEEINKSKVVFGDSAQSIISWAKTTADSAGISERAALQAASGFGNMFRTTGLAGDEAAKMSQRLVQLASDMASFNNQDPEEMLEKLRSGLAGEAEPLRTVGVLLSEARVKQEAYDAGIARSGAALTEAQKVQARYALILKDTALQQGDFERTSDSLANSQRRLKANIEDLSSSIGGVLVPAMEKATGVAIDFVDALEGIGGGLSAASEKIEENTGGWFDWGDAILVAQGPLGKTAILVDLVRDALDDSNEALEAGAGAWTKYGNALAGAAGQVDAMQKSLAAMKPSDNWPFPSFGVPGTAGAGAGGATFPLPAGTDFTRGGGVSGHAGRGSNWQSRNAIDIMADPGTPVLAVVSGTISHTSGRNPNEGTVTTASGAVTYGLSVTINGDDGVQYFYTHLDSLQVQGGMKVNKGQVIGYIAAWKENPTAAHVHFAQSTGSPEAIYGAGQTSAASTFQPGTSYDAGAAATPASPKAFKLPARLRYALAKAGISDETKLDMKALEAAEAFIEKRLEKVKKIEKRTELLGVLSDIKSQIDAIKAAAEAEKAEKEKARLEAALVGIDSISDKVHASIEKLGILSARVVDVKDAEGNVVGRKIGEQTTVKYNPVKGLWEEITFTPEIEAGKRRLEEIKKILLETKKKRDMAWKAINKEMAQKPSRRNASKLRVLRLKHKAFKEGIKELEREGSLLAAQLVDLGEQLKFDPPADAPDESVSAETRLALARAGLTEGQEDDLAALRISESEVSARLAAETDIERQIGLTNELASIRSSIRAIEGASKAADEIDKALLEREQAKREFAERAARLTQEGFRSFFPGLGLDPSGRVVVNINSAFPPTPEVSRQLGEALSQSFGNQGYVPATRETIGV